MLTACPVCESAEWSDVLSLPQMPVLINAQVTPDQAPDVPRGDIDLVVCHGCGHLYNRSFDESLLDYDASYENTLHFSPSFQTFASELADRLVSDYELAGSTVAELGSGPGHFLSMLCERGVARGFGFDPSYDPGRLGAPEHAAVAISTDRFPADGSFAVDMAYSQHVLEHLPDPVGALDAQRRAVVEKRGSTYSEVPNGAFMIEQCALWDLIYEHLSYFVPTSFTTAHRRAGLELRDTGAAFGGQFLWGVSRPDAVDGIDEDELDRAIESAIGFGERARARIASARRELVAQADAGPVALWGAGSKGMTYLNLVDTDQVVAKVIDINPRKAGQGVPGTNAVVSPPERLVGDGPCTVLAANPIYVAEIEQQLTDLGVAATVRPLWS